MGALETPSRPVQNTPADLLSYQRDLVRTGDFIPRGRINKIALGPSADYVPPEGDPLIDKYGRLIDFGQNFLPIGQSRDETLVLITKPWIHPDWGIAGLPDRPHPAWTPPNFTRDEITLAKPTDYKKRTAPMVPQRLFDRANQESGRPAVLEGTDFVVFQPVLCITFQPEFEGKILGTIWKIACAPDRSGMYPVLLVDHKTGEAHFYGGQYLIVKPTGEN
jgi:hypothetical protein